LAYGTIGAQLAIANPDIRKIIRVARVAFSSLARPSVSSNTVSTPMH
jgi:hypothetical protein